MKKLRIMLISTMAIVLIFMTANLLYVSYTEQKELYNQPYYELYSSYYKVRDEYRMFLMVNPHKSKEAILEEIFTESFIKDTITRFGNTGYGEHVIRVYMISPSEELQYGWEKSEGNISANFDQSVFHRNTYCIVTISFHAKNLQECTIENLNHIKFNTERTTS